MSKKNYTSYNKEDIIFVQIASYRDPELQHTLQDLFKKAKRPENIFVGICHQYDMKEGSDKHLFEVPFPRPKQLRIDEIDYRESKGCCWARNRVQKLYDNEKWTLMIDSHMRFEKDWDEILVDMIKSLIKKDIKNPVLTHYPPGYSYSDKDIIYSDWMARMRPTFSFKYFDGGNVPEMAQPPVFDKKYDFPVLNCGLGANYVFVNALSIKDIKYDKYLYFHGEEISLSVRFWTSGYNTYSPNKIALYHKYDTGTTQGRKKIQDSNQHRKDIKNHGIVNAISFSRVKEMLNIKKTNDQRALINLEEYSIGYNRTLRDYERFSGVNFRKRGIRERTHKAIYEEWQEVSNIKTVKDVFSNGSGSF